MEKDEILAFEDFLKDHPTINDYEVPMLRKAFEAGIQYESLRSTHQDLE